MRRLNFKFCINACIYLYNGSESVFKHKVNQTLIKGVNNNNKKSVQLHDKPQQVLEALEEV